MRLTLYFNWFFAWLLFVSCTTVKKAVIKYKLNEARDRTSEQVTYSPPPPPFQKQEDEHLDAFWWNETTKNSISYFSSCPKNNLPVSLKEIERGILLEITNAEIIKTVEKKNTRYTEIQAPANEGEIRTGIYIIKTSKCFYVLNFVANSPKSFKKDEPVFQKFISGFKGL